MTDDELLYEILNDSDKAKSSNEEALKQFYWKAYGISLPDLKGCISIQTVFRKIRKIKEVHPELKGSEETIKAKEDKECDYKEIARCVPDIEPKNIEQMKLGGMFW